MLTGSIDPHYAIAGFLVGALVGVTGVGGGSLMTPILIVLFGVSPSTAVGTDLLFAAATKTVGSLVHGFNRTIDWRVVRRLATGSIPATALALMVLSWLNMRTGSANQIVTAVLTVALLLTARALIARNRISNLCHRVLRKARHPPDAADRRCRPLGACCDWSDPRWPGRTCGSAVPWGMGGVRVSHPSR
jgi:uncharacterized protein